MQVLLLLLKLIEFNPMNNISKLIVVSAQEIITYTPGVNGIVSISERHIQTSNNITQSFYVGVDDNGEELISVSANTPIIVERYG